MLHKVLAGAAALLPVGALASSAALSLPPENMVVGHYLMTQAEGYVSSVFYFTPAQMADADWEFRRIQASQMNMCQGFQQIIHREVKWFETTPASDERCARVVYTVVCRPNDQGAPEPTPAQLEAFSTNRDLVLNEPPHRPIEPGCGEKDRAKLPPPPPPVRTTPPPPAPIFTRQDR